MSRPPGSAYLPPEDTSGADPDHVVLHLPITRSARETSGTAGPGPRRPRRGESNAHDRALLRLLDGVACYGYGVDQVIDLMQALREPGARAELRGEPNALNAFRDWNAPSVVRDPTRQPGDLGQPGVGQQRVRQVVPLPVPTGPWTNELTLPPAPRPTQDGGRTLTVPRRAAPARGHPAIVGIMLTAAGAGVVALCLTLPASLPGPQGNPGPMVTSGGGDAGSAAAGSSDLVSGDLGAGDLGSGTTDVRAASSASPPGSTEARPGSTTRSPGPASETSAPAPRAPVVRVPAPSVPAPSSGALEPPGRRSVLTFPPAFLTPPAEPTSAAPAAPAPTQDPTAAPAPTHIPSQSQTPGPTSAAPTPSTDGSPSAEPTDPSLVQPSVIQPSAIQPSAIQPSAIQPSVVDRPGRPKGPKQPNPGARHRPTAS